MSVRMCGQVGRLVMPDGEEHNVVITDVTNEYSLGGLRSVHVRGTIYATVEDWPGRVFHGKTKADKKKEPEPLARSGRRKRKLAL